MATAGPVRTNWHPSKKHSDVERFVKHWTLPCTVKLIHVLCTILDGFAFIQPTLTARRHDRKVVVYPRKIA